MKKKSNTDEVQCAHLVVAIHIPSLMYEILGHIFSIDFHIRSTNLNNEKSSVNVNLKITKPINSCYENGTHKSDQTVRGCSWFDKDPTF